MLNGNTSTAELRKNMQRVMQEDAAVFRSKETLAEGMQKNGGCFFWFGRFISER